MLLYIDPGAGSIIIQTIIAGILGFIFLLKNYWLKIKEFVFKNIFKKDIKSDE